MLRTSQGCLIRKVGAALGFMILAYGSFTIGSSLTKTASGAVPGGQIRQAETEGFDSCGTLSDEAMNTWSRVSPYSYVGFYLGGRNNGECSNPNKEWIQKRYTKTENTIRWNFLPLWVGRQSQCTQAGAYYDFSNSIATAEGEAIEEADAAIRHAEGIGFAQGAILWYDVEPWETGNSTCVKAFEAFMNVWTRRLHSQEFKSGVYAGDCEGFNHLAGVANPPDDIWMAHFWPKGTPRMESVYTVNCVENNLWEVHRFHQFDGHYEGEPEREYREWGGIKLQVDTDCAFGPVDGNREDAQYPGCYAK
jgi:hypothetical protein